MLNMLFMFNNETATGSGRGRGRCRCPALTITITIKFMMIFQYTRVPAIQNGGRQVRSTEIGNEVDLAWDG